MKMVSLYIVQCQELQIYRQFSDKHTAQVFAEQLAKDYPTAKIERWERQDYFDTWEQA
ncbi:hypothetical protein [Moraxella marmotae]|uniref:hypothetical protein n=1 Tax=Moraxella marmotae TaxID=3344520 RepID=UPI0035F32770